MQTKRVVKVREAIKTYSGKNGQITVHGITVEDDPQEWEYHSLQPTCSKFKPNEEVTFTTEVKQNNNYTNYKISPINTTGPFVKGAPFKQESKDQGLITALSSVSTAVNFYQHQSPRVNEDIVLAFAEKIFIWANSKSTK